VKLAWFIVGLAILPVGWATIERLRDPDRIQPLLDQSSVSADWVAAVGQAMPGLVRGTRFQDHWQIGGLDQLGTLRVILLDSRRLRGARTDASYLDNCTYVGGHSLIVCDVALFDHFLHERALDMKPARIEGDRPNFDPVILVQLPAAELATTRRSLVDWILGHELGHVLNGDGGGHFERRLSDPTDPDTTQQARELAADATLVDRFPDANGSDADFYRFLVGVPQVEINRKACPDVPSGQRCRNLEYGAGIIMPSVKLKFVSEGTHPEYLVWLLRLLEVADQRENLGLIGYLDRQLIHNGLIKLTTLCAPRAHWWSFSSTLARADAGCSTAPPQRLQP
jgi:hypothetical protein